MFVSFSYFLSLKQENDCPGVSHFWLILLTPANHPNPSSVYLCLLWGYVSYIVFLYLCLLHIILNWELPKCGRRCRQNSLENSGDALKADPSHFFFTDFISRCFPCWRTAAKLHEKKQTLPRSQIRMTPMSRGWGHCNQSTSLK